MQRELSILVRLLKNFHKELTRCIEHQSSDFMISIPGLVQVTDPILLGDFIVDAYNNYLASAKAICNDPMVQAFQGITRLEAIRSETEEHEGGDSSIRPRIHGKDPRLRKMGEVALASKQLLTLLEGIAGTIEDEPAETLNSVITLLENLHERIQQTREDNSRDPFGGLESVPPIVKAYNRCLALALEAQDDPVLRSLFQPIESATTESIAANREEYRRTLMTTLAEVEIAQSGLLKYLQRTLERRK